MIAGSLRAAHLVLTAQLLVSSRPGALRVLSNPSTTRVVLMIASHASEVTIVTQLVLAIFLAMVINTGALLVTTAQLAPAPSQLPVLQVPLLMRVPWTLPSLLESSMLMYFRIATTVLNITIVKKGRSIDSNSLVQMDICALAYLVLQYHAQQASTVSV